MAALNGFEFSPYIEGTDGDKTSSPAPCIVSFFGRGDLEGNLIDFLPGQNTLVVQPTGAIANENIALDVVRSIRLTTPVDIKRSVEHLHKRGITVQSMDRKLPFTLTYRDGQLFTGELHGYGVVQGGLGVYLVDSSSTEVDRGIRCYFPASSIDTFSVGEKLGTLLLEKKDLTESGLASALETQRTLRYQKLGDFMVEKRIVDQPQLEQAIREQGTTPVRRLGEVLIESGIINEAQLDTALDEQKRRRGRPLGEILIEMGLVGKEVLREVLAQKLGIPHVDLTKFRIEDSAFNALPMALIQKHRVIPLYRSGDNLVIAMENPLDARVIDALRFATQAKIVPVLATRDEIEQVLQHRPGEGLAFWPAERERDKSPQGPWKAPENAITYDPSATLAEDLALQLETESAPSDQNSAGFEDTVKETDNTLVKLVNKIILDARDQGASDIHIEPRPGKENTRIRFRRDGSLYDYIEVPSRFRSALVARVKIMANLDISEKRRPQDGKIDFKRYGPARIELRVATIPTNNNLESVVLRILTSAEPLPMEKLQLAPRAYSSLRALAEKPYGLILVCGPTGSGKTTTLHSIVGHINTPERKIWTAEDPVEITQAGLSQVQINPKIGWTFAMALRAFLRADPDVIVIGEMRDQETAEIAVEASLTGHLVLSTLHTNSAAESVTRLLDMGLDPFNFADALLGVLAQRLARRLCVHCRISAPGNKAAISELAEEYCADTTMDPAQIMASWETAFATDSQIKLATPTGCKECSNTGFRGRIALHELLAVTSPIRHLIRRKSPVSEIVPAAMSNGMRSLKQDGIEKVLQGFTTMEQVRAVCS